MSEYKPEDHKEVDRPLDDRINKVVFDTGKHFCSELDELEFGQYYTESRKLPPHEREDIGPDNYTFEEDIPYAENKTVVITDIDGNNVYVADLFREGEEVISGASRLCRVTPEGWILPDGIKNDEITAETIAEMPEAYLTHFDGTPGAEMARLSQKVQPPKLIALEATPPTEEEQYRYYG